MMVLDLSNFFAYDIFLYLRLIALAWISKIRYVFDWENNFLAEK